MKSTQEVEYNSELAAQSILFQNQLDNQLNEYLSALEEEVKDTDNDLTLYEEAFTDTQKQQLRNRLIALTVILRLPESEQSECTTA